MNNLFTSTHVSTYFNDALIDRIDTQKYLRSNGSVKKVICDNENQYTASIDEQGNVTIIVHKLNRYVSIKPSSPVTHLVFIGNGNILIGSKNGHISQYLASSKAIYQIQFLNKWQTIWSYKTSYFQVIRQLLQIKGIIKEILSRFDLQIQNIDFKQKKALEYNPVARQILSISHDQCTLWDAANLTKIKTLFAKSSRFSAGALTPNGQNLITSFQDGNVYVWNLSNFEVTAKNEVEENMKNQKICVSPDSQRFAIVGDSASLYYCDLSHQPLYFSSFMLPSCSTSGKKIKFTHGSYLGLITDTQAFYCIDSSTNHIDLEFRLPKNKGIVDFDINGNNLELLTVSGSGEIFKHDLRKLIILDINQQKRRIQGGIESELAINILKPGNQSNMFKSNPQIERVTYGKENIVINGEAQIVSDPDDLLKSCNPITESNITRLCTFPKHTLEKMFKSALISVETLPNMTTPKLRQFLNKHKIFPDKHRALIYKQLLSLPLNVQHFAALVQKGLYGSFRDLYRKYPISDSKLCQKFQTILSCLANFCELFGESDQFIQIAFPFVKIFGQEELLAFEIILCFTHQILQNYFVDFPHPPLDILQNIDEIIKYNEPVLHAHLRDHGFKFVDYIWPFLKGFFTSAIDKESWLQLVDNLIAYNDSPELFMFITAAFVTQYLI